MNKDINLIRSRFSKAAASYDEVAMAQKNMARELILLVGCNSRYDTVYEIGCGTGFLSALILENIKCNTLYLNDISKMMLNCCKSKVQSFPQDPPHIFFVEGDATAINVGKLCDLIVSNAVFQWFFDLKSALLHIKNNLQPDGVLCFSTFLNDTCVELKALNLPYLSYLSEENLCGILNECGFAIQNIVSRPQSIVFADPHHLLRFFKDTGANSLAARPWTRGQLQEFVRQYAEKFKAGNGVRLSWHPCYVKARLM